MKYMFRLYILGLVGALVCGVARADDVDPGDTKSVPVLATADYVQGAYGALDGKKQDKITNANNAGNNIAIDDNGKIGLDLAGLVNGATPSEDGTYVLTIKVVNGAPVLAFEDIERSRDNDMSSGLQ